MDILYRDKNCIVAQKDIGVVCEDTGVNALPALVREACGGEAYPVHRIDKVAGGAVLLGNSSANAEKLRSLGFDKEYLFITVGSLPEKSGVLSDYMFHDTQKNKSYVVKRMRRGVREASLEYTVLSEKDGYALVKAKMITGRTHQIRLQFSSRKTPLYGDKRYGGTGDKTALWSYKLKFTSGGKERTVISVPPVSQYPWSLFGEEVKSQCTTL
jgi:23S rRNA pseudouridine1911/1915/1917 synthase